MIIIYIGIYFQNYYSIFNLVTKFNIFEANTLKDIEKYNTLLLFLLKSHENNNKILLLGIIERFEEYIAANPELNEQYQKLIQDKYLQKKGIYHSFSHDGKDTFQYNQEYLLKVRLQGGAAGNRRP